MKIQGTPGLTVTKIVRRLGGRREVVALFKFDEQGHAEIDESRLSADDSATIRRRYKEIIEKEEKALTGDSRTAKKPRSKKSE